MHFDAELWFVNVNLLRYQWLQLQLVVTIAPEKCRNTGSIADVAFFLVTDRV